MKVSVSILSNTYKKNDLIIKNNLTNSDYLHIDVMDGTFVPNKAFTLKEIEKCDYISSKKLDIHLMVDDPKKYIDSLVLLNVEYITFHIEIAEDINSMIKSIKEYGIKCGISINPNTNIEQIYPYLDKIDLVLIMCVHPGESGQTFIEKSLDKIEKLKKKILEVNSKALIEVDGGINSTTSLLCKEKGADMLVSASYLHHDDMIERVKYLKNL